MTEPAQHLLSILSASEPGNLQNETLAWLSSGIKKYAEGGKSLEQALDLNGGPGGKKKAITKIKEWQRDEYLLKAWKIVSHESISLRQRSEQLSVALDRFTLSRWKNIKGYDHPPENLSELNQLLFYAMKPDIGLPQTGKGLHELMIRILENHDIYNLPSTHPIINS